MLYKQTHAKQMNENGTMDIVVCALTVDRDGEVVLPMGCRSEKYMPTATERNNPVVLWDHGYDHARGRVPIAKAVDLKMSDVEVVETWEFASDEFSQGLKGMYAKQFLNAASVGFLPITVSQEHVLGGQNGVTYVEWELIETSAVSVPSNREALASLAAGGDMMAKSLIARAVEKGVVPFQNLPLSEADSWDGSAAVTSMRRMCSSDGSGDKEKMDWGRYAKGFCWFDSMDKESFGAYKLPIARAEVRGAMGAEDGAMFVVWPGCAAAMGALLGARGGVNIPADDRRGVYGNLVRYYKKFDKEPPEFRGIPMEVVLAKGEGPEYKDITFRAGEPEIVEEDFFAGDARRIHTASESMANIVRHWEKDGRVLSARNMRLVQDAVDALQALLDAARREESASESGATDKAAMVVVQTQLAELEALLRSRARH